MADNDKVVNIFWTGGMDSTFRVLQLLLTTSKIVQPHYIIFEDKATGVEIDAMIKMRKIICASYPEVTERFNPTIYSNEKHITKFKEIDDAVNELRSKIKVIHQYYLMANYCIEHEIDNIEVAIIYLEGEMELFTDYKDSLIFRNFSFPVINLSKKMIYEISLKQGWEHILKMTSFCKRPVMKIQPCGVCSPCTTAVLAGMGFRLPFKTYLIAKLQMPLRQYIRKHYSTLKDNKYLLAIQKKLYE